MQFNRALHLEEPQAWPNALFLPSGDHTNFLVRGLHFHFILGFSSYAVSPVRSHFKGKNRALKKQKSK